MARRGPGPLFCKCDRLGGKTVFWEHGKVQSRRHSSERWLVGASGAPSPTSVTLVRELARGGQRRSVLNFNCKDQNQVCFFVKFFLVRFSEHFS